MKPIQKIFKWITLLFFGIAIYAMTIGQVVPIEFADWHHMHLFYDFDNSYPQFHSNKYKIVSQEGSMDFLSIWKD